MDILWIILIGTVIFTLVASSLVKYRSIGFILVAVAWLAFAHEVPQYLGLPIDVSLVGTRQALVLSHTAIKDKIYILVRFIGEDTPRYVILPNTDDNKNAFKEGNTMQIIQFNSTERVSHVDLNNSEEFSKPLDNSLN